jgi:CRP-like cAMP-binding protein
MENPEVYLGRLRPIYIFKGLSEEEILEAAAEFEVAQVKAGETIFEQGDEGQEFYILNRGQAKVLRTRPGRAPEQVALLVPGDFFGEGALLYGRRRSATLEAATDLELLRLSKEDFDDLLQRFPRIKPNLLLSHESHELYRRSRFDWLGKNEVVYLIARRHKLVMLQSLVPPVVVGGLIGLVAVWLAVGYEALWIAWTGAALEVLVALWLVWNYIDWSNDYYIVTNQRVVHLEKIVAIYDSRIEAPLSSVMSVNVQTDDTIQRALAMGDVVVRTFTGPIVLTELANPSAFAAAIEEFWHRTQTHEHEAQLAQMNETLRSRLEPRPPAAPAKPKPPAPAKPPKPLSQQMADFFSLRVRFEQDGNVIYRKHWFILWARIWKPSLAMVGVFVALALAIAYLPASISIATLVLVALVALIPLALWWLYEFVDWHNDIYMVTRDQIFDLAKKPLGAETKKSAPLANVLSLKYERPGLLGLLLNYGTVVANVAGSDFRFDGVFDPVSVQNDVYRRLEADKTRREAAEAAKRREEIAE